MNKKVYSILSLLIVVFITCLGIFVYVQQDTYNNDPDRPPSQAEQNTAKDIRQVVWQQLNSVQKEQLRGTWSDATVSTVTLEGVLMIGVEDKSYEGEQAYMIAYPAKNVSIEYLFAIADMDSHNLIGFAPVD